MCHVVEGANPNADLLRHKTENKNSQGGKTGQKGSTTRLKQEINWD